MDAPRQHVVAYVPITLTSFDFRIEDACDSTVNDNNGTNNNTFFDFSAASVTGGYSVGPGTIRVECTSGVDLILTVNIDPSIVSTTTIQTSGGPVSYYELPITARTETELNPYYVNRFRYDGATGGTLFGFAATNGNPGTNTQLYTGIAYSNAPGGWGWDTALTFALECTAPAVTTSIFFFDTDHVNANSSSSPYWQNNLQPMRWQLWSYDRATGGDQRNEGGPSGLGGDNNQPDATPLINFTSDRIYQLVITNVNYVNSIQIALPLKQIHAKSSCNSPPTGTNPTGSFSMTCDPGTGVINVTVTASDADGGNVTVTANVSGAGVPPSRTASGSGTFGMGGTFQRAPDGSIYTVTGTVTDDDGVTVDLRPVSVTCARPAISYTCRLMTNPVITAGIEVGSPFDLIIVIDRSLSSIYELPINNTTHPITVGDSPPGLSGVGPSAGYTYTANPGSVTQVTDGGISSNTPNTYTIAARVGDVACPPIQIIIGLKSYLKIYGGDVWAGGGFGEACSAGSGGVAGWARPNGQGYAGASSQFTLTALLNINEFYSVSTRQIPENTAPPKGLTFANTTAAEYGSGFGGTGRCMIDYYNETKDSTLNAAAAAPFPPSTPPPTYTDVAPSSSKTASSTLGGYSYSPEAVTDGLYGVAPTAGNKGEWASNGGANNVTWIRLTWTTPVTLSKMDIFDRSNLTDWVRTATVTFSDGSSIVINDPPNDGETPLTRTFSARSVTWMQLTINDKGGSSNTGFGEVRAYEASTTIGKVQYNISGNWSPSGFTIPKGAQVAVYVDGDAYIGGNITLDPSPRTSRKEIPYFALIVRGNIYIDNNVTQIDGLYVAQPNGASGGRIYTCFPVNPLGNKYTLSELYNNCQTQLSINGALLADKVRFLRVFMSLKDATFNELPNFANGSGIFRPRINNAAEIINYTPEMYLADRPFKLPDETAGDTDASRYDAITGLPPIY
ncbi:hypothetical protein H0V99_00480 [Candidatus Saccharibacteria bacterium]|nr:hypothetical protein [Candidatus Saccharibacteria bacterium]